MKSSEHGKSTSKVEVTNVSQFGLWLFFEGQEHFLPYEKFPWFKDASISQIANIQVFGKASFHWPDLDVDLSIEIIQHPENYRLISKNEHPASG